MTTATNHPELVPLEHEPLWRDPIINIPVPKRIAANLRFREMLLRKCAEEPAWRSRQRQLCAKSALYWMNAFVWTYRIKMVDEDGHERNCKAEEASVPFITWPIQDKAILELQACIEGGEDALLDKSRDMGASWICAALFTHYWLFVPESHLMMVSRIEDLVDKKGDPDSLFWKIDYINQHLPTWMMPRAPGRRGGDWHVNPWAFQRGGDYRSHMHLENPELNCTIDGQASTEHVGRGGRRKAVLYDEMAAMMGAEQAWISAADTTSCRIANSTPIGPGTKFSKLQMNAVKTGSPRLITLGYWNHPTKGLGRELRTDDDGVITNLAGRVYWWTPFFEKQLRKRSPQDIGQNLLIDHVTSGNLFFNSTMVTRHMTVYALDRKPIRASITPDGAKFVLSDHGNWWLLPGAKIADGKPFKGTNYVMFADIAQGLQQSNSVIAVMDRETRRGVAEYACPNVAPYHLAEVACTAGRLFCGNTREAFFGWEASGPGGSMWQYVVKDQDYSYVFYNRILGKRGEPATKQYGWISTRASKKHFMEQLDAAIARERIVLPHEDVLREMLEYIFYENGEIGPGEHRDEKTAARAAHGDRVIAWAGAYMMLGEAAKFKPPPKKLAPDTIGHIAGHDKIRRQARSRGRSQDPFKREAANV